MVRHPWHPAVVHFPIACWVLATGLDLVALLAPGLGLPLDAAPFLVWTGLAFAVPAVAAGIVDYVRLPSRVQDSAELNSHIVWMSFALICFLAAAIWRSRTGGDDFLARYGIVAVELIGVSGLARGGWQAGIVVFELIGRERNGR